MKYNSFKLKKSKTIKGYPILLSLRGYENNKIVRKFCNTGLYVDEIGHWDNESSKVKECRGRGLKNKKLRQIEILYENEIYKYNVNNPGRKVPICFLLEWFRCETDIDELGGELITAFWQQHIDMLLEKQRYNTASQFRGGLSSFIKSIKYANKLNFEAVSCSLVEEWDYSMKVLKLKPNTRSYNIRAFRTILKQAIAKWNYVSGKVSLWE